MQNLPTVKGEFPNYPLPSEEKLCRACTSDILLFQEGINHVQPSGLDDWACD